jgi:hypothetical protein
MYLYLLLFDLTECVGKVDVQNPAFDYIPPEFVSLFITNLYVVCMRVYCGLAVSMLFSCLMYSLSCLISPSFLDLFFVFLFFCFVFCIYIFASYSGGHNPSYVYRLLAEYYDPADYEL